MVQLVRTPPCHGGGQGFESPLGRFYQIKVSLFDKPGEAGSILFYGVLAQLGEHLPYKQGVTGSSPVGPIHGRFPEWPKGADCKSVSNAFGGSNPPPPSDLPEANLDACKNKMSFEQA